MQLLQFLAEPIWQKLVFALLHTLWQAPLVAAALYLLLRLIPAKRAELRYALCLGGLTAVVMGGLVTWAILNQYSGGETDGTVVQGSPPAVAATTAITAPPSTSTHDPAGSPPGMSKQPARSSNGSVSWTAAFASCWLTGVGVMLVRAMLLVTGARRLRHDGQPLSDPTIVQAFEQLRSRFRIRRSVRVLVVDGLHSPAVAGVIWPTLLLPMAMVAGMQPEAWLPLLAHELAHIRRYDYLVNLGQLLIEAILFFNPAVWRISRQIRIEREACCDLLAVSATGEPAGYTRVLADWAERLLVHPGLAPTIAFAEGDTPSLLDRAKRLLLPGYRPQMRVSWIVFGIALLVGAGLLTVLWKGTEVAVILAANALTPQERIDRILEAQNQYAPIVVEKPDDLKNEATLEGTVVTSDGSAVHDELHVHTYSVNAKSSYCKAHSRIHSPFSLSVTPGTVWIRVDSLDYASASVGPFRAEPGGLLEDIKIVLEPGFTGRIRLTDPDGTPLGDEDTSVRGSMRTTDGVYCSGIRERAPGPDGVVVFKHAGEGAYSLTVDAPGFETSEREVQLKPDETIEWVLRRAEPTTAVILDAKGAPVADATLRIFAEGTDEHIERMNAWHGPSIGTTDEHGHFKLTQLRRDRVYHLLVETGNQGQHLVNDVRAGQEDLRIHLGPELVIRGRIVGDLRKLRSRNDAPIIGCGLLVKIKDHSYDRGYKSIPVQIDSEAGHFEIRDLLPGKCTINAGHRTVALEISTPINDLTIDLDEKEPVLSKRQVLFKLTVPQDSPSPSGVIEAHSYDRSDKAPPIVQKLRLENGQATLDAYVGGRIVCRPKRLTGYWFEDKTFDELPAADGPFTIEIPALPAGAIVGRVLGPDGKPAARSVNISVEAVKRPPQLEARLLSLPDAELNAVDGTFMVSPLPLDCTYVIKASRDKNMVYSDPILVDGAHPLEKIELQLVKGSDAELQVLDPNGNPASDIPVSFSYDAPSGGGSVGPDPLTGADGKLRFADLNPDPRIKYSVSLPIRRQYVAVPAAPLRLDGTTTVIRLQPGLLLTGRLIENVTGRPIPNAEMKAHSPEQAKQGIWLYYEAEANTDEQGRFRFSNLAEGTYSIIASPRGVGSISYTPGSDRSVTAGQAEPVEIRLTIPSWHHDNEEKK